MNERETELISLVSGNAEALASALELAVTFLTPPATPQCTVVESPREIA
jgi:hypothetical protein